MGAPDPQTHEAVRAGRREQRNMDESLHEDTRKVQDYGGCLYVNPTDYAIKTLGIQHGDTLEIQTYRDKIVIERVDAE